MNDIFDYVVECQAQVVETLTTRRVRTVRSFVTVTFEQTDDSEVYSELARREATSVFRKSMAQNGLVPTAERVRVFNIKQHEVKA